MTIVDTLKTRSAKSAAIRSELATLLRDVEHVITAASCGGSHHAIIARIRKARADIETESP